MFRSVFKSGLRASYNVSENPTLTSEPWQIYPAKHKSSGRQASVFIFDKTKFEANVSRINGQQSPRQIISECYELIRNSINELSKLRHPQVLTVLEPLEETKTKFLFAAEPVTDTLATLNLDNIDELTIQQGLLQIAKCLQFLHNHGNIIHFNLQPSSIYINADGDWKVAGFMFVKNLGVIPPGERENFRLMDNSSPVPFANLNLQFVAPELIFDNSNAQLDFTNDMWSLACIIFYLFNHGEQLIACFDSSNINDYRSAFKKFEQKFYNRRPEDLGFVLKDVPAGLYPVFTRLMARYPMDRLSVDQFIDSDYFNGSIIKAMWFLDEFTTKTLEEKQIFLRALLDDELLEQFPKKFKQTKLLHLATDQVVSELNVLTAGLIDPDVDQLISYLLQLIFIIGNSLSGLTFQDRVYAVIFKGNGSKKKDCVYKKLINSSIKTRLTIVENYDVLNSKLNDREFCDIVRSMLDLVFLPPSDEVARNQNDQIKLQESFLKSIPTFASKFDFPYIKNTLFPMLCTVFKTTTILSTKLETIITFEALVEQKIVDKFIVVEQLLPIFKNLKSRDKRVVKLVLDFFNKLTLSDHIALDLENSVDLVLPQCLSLAFGCSDCTKQEFTHFMATISAMQKKMTEKKLASLSEGRTHDNFDSFISTQQISSGKDSLERNPRSDTLKPQKPSAPSRGSSLQSPQQSQPTSKPLQPQVQAKGLRLQSKATAVKTSNLSFGATNPAEAASTSRMLDTLHSNMDNQSSTINGFQISTPSSPATPTLNWSSESSKSTNTTNNYTPNFVSAHSSPLSPSMQPMQPLTPKSRSTSNFPPGFQANLSPMVAERSTQNKPVYQSDSLI
ncbi:hypothetical protein DIURU_001778 [Diutina rugosa]|uniref:Protein kinase domain-containing protein n=1 Tax=Diutina rugosa TaxID=5481 RepID=A0A642UV28_DIURU|nr:uncharacterized protein DIURU_001778 [Diutina rugosa]KAA8904942.1 hypothetical protein DIURU_001778 [Diutina rugosa]